MAEARFVYFVTHGAKVGVNGDPCLAEPDLCELRALRALLPLEPTHVICGTGRRFAEIAQTLGLTVRRWTPVFGGAEYVEDHGTNGMVRLASGHYVAMADFFGIEDCLDQASHLLADASEDTVIIGGRYAAEQMVGCPTGPVVVRYTIGEGKIRGAEILNATPIPA